MFLLPIETDSALGLHSARSKVEVTTNRSFFVMGPMMVRCETNLYSLWNRMVDGYVREETPVLTVLGSTSSQSQTNNFGE